MRDFINKKHHLSALGLYLSITTLIILGFILAMEASCLGGELCGLGYGLVVLPLIVFLGYLGLLNGDQCSENAPSCLIYLLLVAVVVYPLFMYLLGVSIERILKKLSSAAK
jgi:hypothetical protein